MMKNKQTFALIGLLIVVISLFLPPSITMGKILTIIGIGALVYPLAKSLFTFDYHITVLFVFFFSYMMVPFNYFWFGKHIINYYQCETLFTVFRTLQIMCVFHLLLIYFIKFTKNGVKNEGIKIENNNTIYKILIFLSFAFTTFGQSGATIFESGGYADTLESGSYSIIFAYSVIPTTLACLYANTRKKRIIAYTAIAYFVFRNLIYGGRVDSIQLLLAVFLIRFQYLWSPKKILAICVVGGLFITFWGALRNDVDVDFAELYYEVLKDYFTSDNTIDFQVGNAPEVYYSSIKIIYLIEKGILSLSMRLASLGYFFISAFLPSSYLPEVANLSTFMRVEYYNGGGGLAPVFFYAFLGWAGVVLFSLFIVHCINIFNRRKTSKFLRFYLILMLATTPRWYAYYPIQLIKFCVVGMLFYYILDNIFDRKALSHTRRKQIPV